MHQMTRTLAFVIAASAAVIGAVVAHIATKPEIPTDQAHTLIGQSFYPDFTDPTKPTGIRVAAWSPTTSRVEQFEVRYENGQWRIPSHNNYPADARDQLAKAAASAVGIVRGSLSAETADVATLERLGVVDPLDENVTQGAGTSGTRITLFQGDEVVADYIVGRKFGDVAATPADTDESNPDEAGKQSKEGRFYVRRPDEKLVYLADVKIDVSTKFRDWIQKDLLDLTQGDLRQITINRYSIDLDKGVPVPQDRSELTRATASDPWTLKGLDETKDKVKASVVNAMARALDNLQIIGVRKKPAALAEFFAKGTVGDVLQMMAAQSDMQQRGYFFTDRALLSDEGEFLAGTKDGVQYVLRFGEVFTGSDLEIEVGGAAETTTQPGDGAPATAEAESPPATDTATDPAAEATNSDDESGNRSRYVIVEALLDPTLLGPEPTPPVKPTAPPATAPAAPPVTAPATEPAAPANPAPAAAAPASEPTPPTAETPSAPAADPVQPAPAAEPAAPPAEANCDDPPATEQPNTEAPAAAPAAATPVVPAESTQPDSAAPPATTPAATESPVAPATPDAAAPAAASSPAAVGVEPPVVAPPVERPKTAQDIYREALQQFEQDQETYEAQLKDYQQRLQDAQQRVDVLNQRFADWYYVISADVYEDLRVSREQLVEPVAPPTDPAATEATPPDATFPDLPPQ